MCVRICVSIYLLYIRMEASSARWLVWVRWPDRLDGLMGGLGSLGMHA